MIIRSIDLENIRSHKFTHIEFKNGITVITGDVGSGKTTILESIKFALFGGSAGEYKNLLRMNENNGIVSVELENENGIIKITRKLKRTRDGYSGSNVIISVNGKNKEMSDREMKKFIADLFNVFQYKKKDPLFFRTVIYASQEEMKSIMSMNAEERKEMILDLFQISSYNRILENVEILKEHLRNRIEISKGIIGESGEKIFEEREKIDDLKKVSESLRKEINENEERARIKEAMKIDLDKEFMEYEKIREENEKLENLIKIEEEKYEMKKKEMEKSEIKLKELNEKKKISSGLKEKEERYQELENKFNDMQAYQKLYNELLTQIKLLEKELQTSLEKKIELEKYKEEIKNINERLVSLIKEKIDPDY
ncbi:MAG: AAA family ATPase, partial [Thermoplasmata archaeon]